MRNTENKTALGVAIAMILTGIAILSCVGCSAGVGLRINHAPRCEVQTVVMRWIDGTESKMVLNSCRYGAVGRVPTPDEAK